MKKLISAIFLTLVSLHLFAQEQQAPRPRNVGNASELQAIEMQKEVTWDSNVPKECFCCNDKIYQIPQTPPIVGNEQICKDLKNVYSTTKCDGASYNWSINPSGITFSGQSTNQIAIDFSSIPQCTSVISMTVEIKCGNRVVKNTIKVKVCPTKIIIKEGEDAMLHGLTNLQTNNYGNYTSNVVSNWTFNGTSGVMYSVIKFSFPSCLTANMVSNATLSLREYISAGNGNHAGQYGGATQPTTFVVRRVTSPWNGSLVTFSTMPTTTTANQVTVPTYSGGTANDDLDIDVTPLVKDIINNGNNQGFMIRWNDNANNLQYRSRFFGSFECPVPSKKPFITIN